MSRIIRRLAGTITNSYVAYITASLIDVGWSHEQGRFLTTAPRRRTACGGVLDRLLVIWFRLVPDAGKLRCSNIVVNVLEKQRLETLPSKEFSQQIA